MIQESHDFTQVKEPSALAWAARSWCVRVLYFILGLAILGVLAVPVGLRWDIPPLLAYAKLLFNSNAAIPYAGFLILLGLILATLMVWFGILVIGFSRFSLRWMLFWYVVFSGAIALVLIIEDAEKAFPATLLGFLLIKFVADVVRSDAELRAQLTARKNTESAGGGPGSGG